MDEINQKLDNMLSWIHHYDKENKEKFEEFLTTFSNNQIMLNTLTQITGSQVQVLNQISQQVNLLTSKLTDMEIKNQDSESSLNELSEQMINISNSIEGLKTQVENVRLATFYSYD